MADRRERALDRVRGPQVLPVLGGKIVEGEQGVAVLHEARDRLVVLDPVGLDKGLEGDQRLLFGLGHPDLLQRALGLPLQALGQLVQDVDGLVHPTALAARLGPDLLNGLPEAECAVGDRKLRAEGQPPPPEVEQQLPPGLHALAHAIGQANKLLLALRGGADDHEKALGVRLKAGLHVDAINPDVDVTFGRQIALGPPGMLVRPGVLEAGDARGGEPTRVRAEQRRECVLKVAAGDALEIQDWDQNLEALRAARVGRQDRGREPDAALTSPDAVANPRRAHRNRAQAGHNLALWPMTMAHQPLAAILGLLISVAAEEGCDLSLDGLRQQRSRALAQNFGERIGELGWLDQLDDVILDHGVSLLWWRSGGSNTPTIRRLNPAPSPTSAHTSPGARGTALRPQLRSRLRQRGTFRRRVM